MTDTVTLELCDTSATPLATLTIECLNGQGQWHGTPTIVDARADPAAGEEPGAPVQLLEEINYQYQVGPHIRAAAPQVIEPAELVTYAHSPATGRLSAGRSTGMLRFAVTFSDGSVGFGDLEIRSRKLDYKSEYRSMLHRIAREAAELTQSAFAASSLPALRPDPHEDPQTTYQRFAFIQALIESDEIRDALRQIQRRPHIEHRVTRETIDPARTPRANRDLARQLTAPGPRQRLHRPVAGMTDLPVHIQHSITETTYDSIPNRFVRYVLTRWLTIATDVNRALSDAGPAARRGRQDTDRVADLLRHALTAPALAEAGTLTQFPHANQVIQRRSGYREILGAFLLAESAATITWAAGHQLFRAGQRNVAELYEYWVFLELVRIVEQLPGFAVDRRNLIRRTANGLSLDLLRDRTSVVHATGDRHGTRVEIDVYFNKQFPKSNDVDADRSWTIPLRPDCSLKIRPQRTHLNNDTWIHFDAKYRMHELLLTDDDVAAAADTETSLPKDGRAIPADLAKMHTYRDAIRRTAGAYVLYPGTNHDRADRQYHEVLPGLGAFSLRPASDGNASETSSQALVGFIDEVVEHVAAQGTAAERARYWETESYQRYRGGQHDYSELLERPPADTAVLVGFVKSEAHLRWIRSSGRYNLRADPGRSGAVGIDAAELTTDFVLLYGPDMAPLLFRSARTVEVRTAEDLQADGYPNPRGNRYFCVVLGAEVTADLPDSDDVAGATSRRSDGRPAEAPLLLRWDQLAGISRSAH